MNQITLDGHTHCGYTVPFRDLAQEWRHGGISGGVVFSPVEEIYNRYDPCFTDSEEYRRSRGQVHDYLLGLARREKVFPYFFVWNDFVPIPEGFVGIKWHRHPGEPVYEYHTRGCDRIVDEICSRQLPIVLEEEFTHTLDFIKRIKERTVVIIPHMGGLNGGYHRLKGAGVFESPAVWVDTALAGPYEIEDFAGTYGTERIIFGSDYPFGVPALENHKVTGLFSGDDLSAVIAGNLRRLLKISEMP